MNLSSVASHAISAGSSTLPGGTGQITNISGSSVSQTSSLLTIAGIAVEVLALFAFMAIVGLFIIIVVANRADPDPSGRRPQSVYYFAVSFVTLVTTIVGSIVVFVSLV